MPHYDWGLLQLFLIGTLKLSLDFGNVWVQLEVGSIVLIFHLPGDFFQVAMTEIIWGHCYAMTIMSLVV